MIRVQTGLMCKCVNVQMGLMCKCVNVQMCKWSPWVVKLFTRSHLTY